MFENANDSPVIFLTSAIIKKISTADNKINKYFKNHFFLNLYKLLEIEI